MVGRRGRVARAALAALTVVAGLGVSATVAPSPAGAALVPRSSGELVVDETGDQLFVTDGDTVSVRDLDGDPTATITGQPGVVDLLLRDRTLYVLLPGRINRIDADTHQVTGGWPLTTMPGADHLAWTGARIWFTFTAGAVGSLDPATGTLVRHTVARIQDESDIAASEAPARIQVLGPGSLTTIDVSGATPTVVAYSATGNDCTNAREIAVSDDGVTGWTACGYPYRFNSWDMATLVGPISYLAATPYPNGISRSADGGLLIGSLQARSSNVLVYTPNTTIAAQVLTSPVQPAAGMVAVTNDGSRAYVGTVDGGLRTFHLDPEVTAVDPTPVKRAATVTVTGLRLGEVTAATLGGIAAPVTVLSPTSVQVTVPAELADGPHPLVLTSRWGDNADAPFTVTVEGSLLPDAPAQPTVTSAGPHGAEVTWPLPSAGSQPVTQYELTRWVDGVADEVEIVTEAEVLVDGLLAETTYTWSVVAINDLGRSQPSPESDPFVPAGPDVSPFASLTAFVARQHADIVGRAPTATETDSWVSLLRSGEVTPGDVVQGLRQSADNAGRVDPVVRLYRAYFQRTPDVAGLDYWVAKLRSGTSTNQVSQSFSGSSEFRTMYGSLGNRAFVQRVYRNVLGREGEPAGVDYWTAQLDSGRRNRGTVMLQFSESPENVQARRAEVDAFALYALLLDRRPTVDELATTTGRLGSTTVATIADEILTSDEYEDRITG